MSSSMAWKSQSLNCHRYLSGRLPVTSPCGGICGILNLGINQEHARRICFPNARCACTTVGRWIPPIVIHESSLNGGGYLYACARNFERPWTHTRPSLLIFLRKGGRREGEEGLIIHTDGLKWDSTLGGPMLMEHVTRWICLLNLSRERCKTDETAITRFYLLGARKWRAA